MIKNLPNKVHLAYFALVITALIWGAAPAVIKVTLEQIPPITFLFLRFLIVCVLLLPFGIVLLKRNMVEKADYLNLFLLGIFCQTSLILLFIGLKYTTSLDSAIIGVLSPMMAIVAGHHFFNEKVNNWVKLGIALATLGTAFIILEPITADDFGFNNKIDVGTRILGNVLVLSYNIVFTVYLIWSKATTFGTKISSVKLNAFLEKVNIHPMKRKYSSEFLTIFNFYIGLITILPVAVLEYFGFLGPLSMQSFSLGTLDVNGILGLLYMVIFSSIVAYLLFQWALAQTTVEDTAIFSYITPVFTVPFAYLLLGEIPTQVTLVGAIVITVGIVIAETKKS